MNIPKTFRSERNLDEKTEQLREEANLKVTKLNELEEILEGLSKQKIHDPELCGKIERLRTKIGYEKFKGEPDLEIPTFWIKPYDSKKSKVLIDKIESISPFKVRYTFAIVENKKLPKFCKKYEKYERMGKLEFDGTNLLLGGFTGLITGGIAASYAIIPYLENLGIYRFAGKGDPVTTASLSIGVFLGGFIIGNYKWLIKKRRVKKFYKNIITNDALALEAAFS